MHPRSHSNTRLFAVAAALSAAACLPDPNTTLPQKPEVEVFPLATDGAERVLRFAVKTPGTPLDPSEAWLFQGELSDYYVGRVNRRDLPETLLARRVAVNAWLDSNTEQTLLEPSAPLEPGAVYTLAAPGWGTLAQIHISQSSALGLMKRLWPPIGVPGAALAVFCGADGADLPAAPIELAPSGVRANIVGLMGQLESGEPCTKVSIGAPGTASSWQVFPPLALGVTWDPEPFDFAEPEPLASAVCDANEIALASACAMPKDDRVIVRGAAEPLLFALARGDDTALFAMEAGARFELRGLTPDSSYELRGSVTDRFGNEEPFAVTVRTAPAAPHLVLNEVLANALGPEPAGEWIELVNDGSLGIDLGDLRLQDSGGVIALPSVRVEAGQFAVIVREDYADNGLDVPIGPGTLLVRVPMIGKGGLTNSGEALTLLDRSNAVLSRFPARASAHAGVSVARRAPSAPDDAADSFGEHASPGASPGRSNTLAD